MSTQVVLEIRLGVTERHAMVLEKCVHLEPRVKSEQTPHLTLGQRASAVALNCKRFERLPSHAHRNGNSSSYVDDTYRVRK